MFAGVGGIVVEQRQLLWPDDELVEGDSGRGLVRRARACRPEVRQLLVLLADGRGRRQLVALELAPQRQLGLNHLDTVIVFAGVVLYGTVEHVLFLLVERGLDFERFGMETGGRGQRSGLVAVVVGGGGGGLGGARARRNQLAAHRRRQRAQLADGAQDGAQRAAASGGRQTAACLLDERRVGRRLRLAGAQQAGLALARLGQGAGGGGRRLAGGGDGGRGAEGASGRRRGRGRLADCRGRVLEARVGPGRRSWRRTRLGGAGAARQRQRHRLALVELEPAVEQHVYLAAGGCGGGTGTGAGARACARVGPLGAAHLAGRRQLPAGRPLVGHRRRRPLGQAGGLAEGNQPDTIDPVVHVLKRLAGQQVELVICANLRSFVCACV